MLALNLKVYHDMYTSIPVHEDPRGPTWRQNRARQRLYLALRYLLQRDFGFDPDRSTTRRAEDFPGGFGRSSPHGPPIRPNASDEILLFASVYGILLATNQDDPSLGKLPLEGRPTELPSGEDIWLPTPEYPTDGETILIVPGFVRAVSKAVIRFNSNKMLFSKVFDALAEAAIERGEDGTPIQTTWLTRRVAEVTRRLIYRRVKPTDPHLRLFVANAVWTR